MVTYGVVVVFSACMIQVLTFGIATSIGLYNIELLEYYGGSAAETSMIGSINLGVFLGAGPLASFLMSKISYRSVALLGAFLSSAGLLCIPFAPNILFIDVFYGVFTGMSRLSVGMGYIMLANGIGNMAGPPIAGWLRDQYGTYFPSIYFATATLVTSGVLMFLIPLYRRHIQHRSKHIKSTPVVNGNGSL